MNHFERLTAAAAPPRWATVNAPAHHPRPKHEYLRRVGPRTGRLSRGSRLTLPHAASSSLAWAQTFPVCVLTAIPCRRISHAACAPGPTPIACSIYFGEGMYRPGTVGGQRPLSHGLVHVIQQGRASAPRRWISAPEDAGERQAEAAPQSDGMGIPVRGVQNRLLDPTLTGFE
jgi:hypothetical protein